jgi:hypothetical protein
MSMQRFMECVNYRVTEGSDFGWNCFGDFAYRLDSWSGDQDGHTITIVFDTKTQTCYSLEAFDYANKRAYRWINPDFVQAHRDEAKNREVYETEAWEDDLGVSIKFVDLETQDDFFTKATAIVNGEPYDTRVEVPIDLPNDVLFQLMVKAHEQDITFNQLVEQALQAAIDRHLAGEEPFPNHARI